MYEEIYEVFDSKQSILFQDTWTQPSLKKVLKQFNVHKLPTKEGKV